VGGGVAASGARRPSAPRLAAAAPGHAGWQYDLGASHARIGAALEARGDFHGALAEYEANLAIVARFVAADPDNAGWRRDLAVSHGKLAGAYHRLGQVSRALAELDTARRIMAAPAPGAPPF